MPTTTIDKLIVPNTFLSKDPEVLLVLWNDDLIAAFNVIKILMTVMNFSENKSHKIMLEAHLTGRSVIIQTNRPYAELCKEQLEAEGLTITIEPLGSNY